MILTAHAVDGTSPVQIGGTQEARLIVAVRHTDGRVVSGLDESSFKVQETTPGGSDFRIAFGGEMLAPPTFDSPGAYMFVIGPTSGTRWERSAFAFTVHLTPGFVGDREGHTIASGTYGQRGCKGHGRART